MSKVTLVLNKDQIGAMLKDAEIQTIVADIASDIANRAGEGYASDTKLMGTRVIASVYTETSEALQDNLENNTLLRCLS